MPYIGTALERLTGLSPLIKESKNKSVLDIGCADCLVAYEFVKAGANYICGIDVNKNEVDFAKKLLTKTSVAFNVTCANILETYQKINTKFDIVLYLGMHHHFKKIKERKALVVHLSKICKKYFAVRTTEMEEINTIMAMQPYKFFLTHSGVITNVTTNAKPGAIKRNVNRIGPLKIFERK